MTADSWVGFRLSKLSVCAPVGEYAEYALALSGNENVSV
jgi:hypothetical protein